MLYLSENFSLGQIKYISDVEEAIKNRFFYEFLNSCFDQHLNKSTGRIVKSEFQIPKELSPFVDNQTTLIILTNTKSDKTLVSHQTSTLHLQNKYSDICV